MNWVNAQNPPCKTSRGAFKLSHRRHSGNCMCLSLGPGSQVASVWPRQSSLIFAQASTYSACQAAPAAIESTTAGVGSIQVRIAFKCLLRYFLSSTVRCLCTGRFAMTCLQRPAHTHKCKVQNEQTVDFVSNALCQEMQLCSVGPRGFAIVCEQKRVFR
jgi:hypothetical protein